MDERLRIEASSGFLPPHRFRLTLPAAWRRVPLPAETPGLSSPAAFVPVLICASPDGPRAVTVAVRPSGGIHRTAERALALAREEGIAVSGVGEASVDGCPAVVLDGAAEQRLRRHLFEASDAW